MYLDFQSDSLEVWHRDSHACVLLKVCSQQVNMAEKGTGREFTLSWSSASAWSQGNSRAWMESQLVPSEARGWWFIPPCPSVISNRFLSLGGGWVLNLLAEWFSSAKSSSPEKGAAWVRIRQHSSQKEVHWLVRRAGQGTRSTHYSMYLSICRYLTSACPDVLDPDCTDTGPHHQESKMFLCLREKNATHTWLLNAFCCVVHALLFNNFSYPFLNLFFICSLKN